jgi:hypothetical protein
LQKSAAMNTYRIYEDFKATLGDAAAKSLAQTLGTMFDELKDTVTKEDFRLLRESIDANTARLDGAITRLADAQARTEVRMNELAQAQARTEQEVRTLAEAMQRLTIRTDAVVGRTFELQFRDRLSAYLGRFLRRGKVVGNDVLLDAIEARVTTEEVEDFLRADIVAKGLVDGVETYVVAEVSSTGDTEAIVRAERRAGILRKAGLVSIPLVACDAVSPESLAFARKSGVRVWCNGSLMDAAA